MNYSYDLFIAHAREKVKRNALISLIYNAKLWKFTKEEIENIERLIEAEEFDLAERLQIGLKESKINS